MYKTQSMKKINRLTRDIYPMPKSMRQVLVENSLLEAYKARPPYQQNDYIGWITRAKLEATKQKRLLQMLDELTRGDRYMKMSWKASTKSTRTSS